MKLYCKAKIEGPGGRRFRVTDPVTGMVDYTQKPIRLYNDKGIEVPAKIAGRLLEQDPHLVSKKPYVEPEPRVDVIAGLVSDEKEALMKLRAEKFLEFVDNAKPGPESIHENDLMEFANKLEVDLPQISGTVTKDTWLELLLSAVETYLGEDDEVVEVVDKTGAEEK